MNDKKFIKTKIQKSIKKLLKVDHLKKRSLQRVNFLAQIVGSILLKGSCQISQMALTMNDGSKKQGSQKRQISRFLNNELLNYKTHYFPFAQSIIEILSKRGHLEFSIDGTAAGRGCMALVISLIYKGKALPIIWSTHKAKKGHLPEKVHCDLLARLSEMIPTDCQVSILGDGEFDGCDWQADIVGYKWNYVCRTSKNIELEQESHCFKTGDMAVDKHGCLLLTDLLFTKKKYGPVNILIWHDRKHKEPIFLVTNLEDIYLIKQLYKKRFKIEPLFRDQKSKGFQLDKSGIANPQKLERLLIACFLATVLCIMSGIKALKSVFYDQVAEQNENMLSLFQLGLRFLRLLVDIRQWRDFSWTFDFKT